MIFKMVEKVMKNKTVKDQRLKKNKRFENHRKDIQLYNNYNKVNIRENIEIKNNINNNINIKDRYKDISLKNLNLSEINSKDKNIKNFELYKNLAKDSLVYTNSNGTIKTLANPLMNEEDKKKLNDYIQEKFQYNSNNSNSKNNINIENVKFDISNNNNYQNAKIEQKKKNEDYNILERDIKDYLNDDKNTIKSDDNINTALQKISNKITIGNGLLFSYMAKIFSILTETLDAIKDGILSLKRSKDN